MPSPKNTHNCQVCGTPTKHWQRCEAHCRCDDCGATENILWLVEGVLCSACRQRRIDQRIAEFDGDTEYTTFPVCPHCGHEDSTPWEFDDGTHECEDCGNSFELERHVTVEYSTRKV